VSTLAPTLQAFFTDRLNRQRQASGHTIAAYRDACKLLLAFAEQRTGKAPSHLDVADLDAGLIGAFGDHLEHQRGNSVRTRNARLAAIHSLFRFAALAHPQDAAVIQRVLAIPPKRYDQTLITYLTQPETNALLAAPDQATWTGRRDHALLALAVHTGLRVSELTALTLADIHLGTGAHVSCLGKGRKQRSTPLTGGVTAVLRAWQAERAGAPADPLFATRRGTPLSPDAVQQRLTTHAGTAAATCPTLTGKKLTTRAAPHRRYAAAQRRRGHHRHRLVAGPRAGRHHPGLHPRRPRPQTAGPSPAPPQPAPPQAATSHQTRSSPSSKACDYADLPGTVTPTAAPTAPTSA
jgi:integrase/recombinase XerD